MQKTKFPEVTNRARLELKLFNSSWIALFLSALLILFIGEFTNIDLIIEDFYYDPSLKTFPWKETWFAKELMHLYVKDLIIFFGLLLYLFLLVDFFKPWKKLSAWLRFRYRFVAAASIVVPFSISTLKKFTIMHCPWDINRYNGTAPFIRLLDQIPIGLVPGDCFPAAHATTGFWLASLAVFWLPHNTKKATTVFVIGLTLGMILGWVQQMRGAHFLTHTLWSAWLSSFIILSMLQISLKHQSTFKKPLIFA